MRFGGFAAVVVVRVELHGVILPGRVREPGRRSGSDGSHAEAWGVRGAGAGAWAELGTEPLDKGWRWTGLPRAACGVHLASAPLHSWPPVRALLYLLLLFPC